MGVKIKENKKGDYNMCDDEIQKMLDEIIEHTRMQNIVLTKLLNDIERGKILHFQDE